MDVISAFFFGLKSPVVLFVFAASMGGYGSGPAMHSMPSMEACQSVGRRIQKEMTESAGKNRYQNLRYVHFTCQEIRP